jgi:hypothetical protein
MYRAQAAAGGAPGEAGPTGPSEAGATADQSKGDVIDAEFKDLGGDNKK